MYPIALLFILGILSVTASDIKERLWEPQKHPAIIKRHIIGFTTPSRRMDVSSEFNGRVESVFVQEGDTIIGALGSSIVVVQLDQRFARISRDQAKTALEMAVHQEEQLKTELAIVKRQLDYHRNEVKRIESLALSGKVTQSNLDAAVFDADSSALQVERAQTALTLAETTIADARHTLADAEERLKRHSIVAPAGWIVAERSVEPGAIVQAGQRLLYLADVSKLAIKIRLSEFEIIALRKTKDIVLNFPSQKHPSARAELHRIEVDHDPITNKRLVELRIPGESAPAATGGLEVSLTLEIPDPGGLVMVPRDFLTIRFEQYFVTLEDGSESNIIPLREQGEYMLISHQDLPEAAILTRPGK